MSFQVGDKVVCVRGFGSAVPGTYLGSDSETWSLPRGGPLKDRIYVIADIFPSYPHYGLVLVGLPAIRISTGIDEGFVDYKFRKLDDLKAESRERYYREHPEAQPVS